MQNPISWGWAAGLHACLLREASNDVLRNLDFDYVGNSDHLFISRVSVVFRLSFRNSPLVSIVEDNLGGTGEEAGRLARKPMPPHR